MFFLIHSAARWAPVETAWIAQRPGCVSAEGPYDMMGNLLEWTDKAGGLLRGGYYVDTVLNGAGCLYAMAVDSPAHLAFYSGFRCCATP